MSASALAASPIFKECAKVTVVYLGVYVGAVLYQLVAKVKAEIAVAKKISAAKKNGTELPASFDRYHSDDADLRVADRTVGNMIEWMGPFLVSFWVAAHVVPASQAATVINGGWAYVALRILYPLLALNGGLTQKGARPFIFFSTMPAYAILTYNAINVFKYAFLS